MLTYSHGVIGYLVYLKRTKRERILAVVGSIVPDVIVGIGFIAHPLERLLPGSEMVEQFHQLFHFSALHTVTIVLHSFVVSGVLLGVSIFAYRKVTPFFVGMMLHGVVDFLTHQYWTYNHLWPFDVPPVTGIVSYVSPYFFIPEHIILVVLAVLWYQRRSSS